MAILDVYPVLENGEIAKKPFKNWLEMKSACIDPETGESHEIPIRAFMFSHRGDTNPDVWDAKRDYIKVEKNIENAIQRHFINGEFQEYSKLLKDWKLTAQIPTACTNGWRIYFNPEFAEWTADQMKGKLMDRLEELKKETRRGKIRLAQIEEAKLDVQYNAVLFIFVHECFHQVYMHFMSEKAKFQAQNIPFTQLNHDKANMAQDMEINRDIVRWYPRFQGMRALIGGCWDDKPELLRNWGKIFDEEFDSLSTSDIEPPKGNGGQQGGQQGGDDQQGGDSGNGGDPSGQDGQQGGDEPSGSGGTPGGQGKNGGKPGDDQNSQDGQGGDPGNGGDPVNGGDPFGPGGTPGGQSKKRSKPGNNNDIEGGDPFGPGGPGGTLGTPGGQDNQQSGQGQDSEGGSSSDNGNDQQAPRPHSDDYDGHDPFSGIGGLDNIGRLKGADEREGGNGQGSQDGQDSQNGQNGQKPGTPSPKGSEGSDGSEGSEGSESSENGTPGKQAKTPGQAGKGMGNLGGRDAMSSQRIPKASNGKLDISLGRDCIDDAMAKQIDSAENIEEATKGQTAEDLRDMRRVAEDVVRQLKKKLPDDFTKKMDSIKAELDQSIINWKQILKKIFRSAGVKPEFEDKRKNARMAYGHPAYHLKIDQRKVKGFEKDTADVFYLADASGSMDNAMFYRLFSEVLDLELKSGMNIRKSAFAYWADFIDPKAVVTWTKDTPASKKKKLIMVPPGFSGGTDLALAVFSAIKLKEFYSKSNPETVLIIYTDGEVWRDDFEKVASLGRKFLEKCVFIVVNNKSFLQSLGKRLLKLGVPLKNYVPIDVDQYI